MKDSPSYIDRINAFWNWRLFNPVPDKAVALYFAILHCANRAGFPDEVCVPNSTLLSLVDMEKRDLYRFRNVLVQVGLIAIDKGHKGQAAVYRLSFISDKYGTNVVTNPVTNVVTNPVTNPVTNTAPYIDKDMDTDKDLKETLSNDSVKKRFTPPSVDQVREYCLERNNGIDPQAFVDFYTANGWVQGKGQKPIRDWKACIRTWEQKRKQEPATDHFAAAKSFFGVDKGDYIDI